MAFELRDGQGTLFKNDRKSTERHPDYTGSIKTPDGQEHWFSAWIKTGSQGGKFLSVQIGNPKDKPPAGVTTPGGNAPRRSMKDTVDDLDDREIPF